MVRSQMDLIVFSLIKEIVEKRLGYLFILPQVVLISAISRFRAVCLSCILKHAGAPAWGGQRGHLSPSRNLDVKYLLSLNLQNKSKYSI